MWGGIGDGGEGGAGVSLRDVTVADAQRRKGPCAGGLLAADRPRRLALSGKLSRQGLLVAAMLQRTSWRLLVPSLQARVKGGCLNALAVMSAIGLPHMGSSSPSSPLFAPPRLMSAPGVSSARALAAPVRPDEPGALDRDLRLLLELDPSPVPNFHTDPAPEQAQAAAPSFEGVFRKALHLLSLYPGNAILEHVCLVAGRCLEFPLASPLGKLLAG